MTAAVVVVVVLVIPSSSALGTLSVWPVITNVSAAIPFQEASDSVEIPFAAAIPESVSPSITVWATAPCALATWAPASSAVLIAVMAAERRRRPPDPDRLPGLPGACGDGFAGRDGRPRGWRRYDP